jgi:replication-associated recombination protein RarA
MQKAIRRGDAKIAGFFAIELFESGFGNYVWKRLLTVSAEDCWGILTQEVKALHNSYCFVNERVPARQAKGRIFIAKAVILLCLAKKSRDADHLTNCIYDKRTAETDAAIESALTEAMKHPEEVPEYAFDCHTTAGKRAGKTKAQFFVSEEAALNPKQTSLFDYDMIQVMGK